jgi:hypothetical protein
LTSSWNAKTEQLQEDVASELETLRAPVYHRVAGESVGLSDEGHADEGFEVRRTGPDLDITPADSDDAEQRRREAIERLMVSTAECGLSMAALGFKSTPVPVITWSDAGEPLIHYAGDAGRRRGHYHPGQLAEGRVTKR